MSLSKQKKRLICILVPAGAAAAAIIVAVLVMLWQPKTPRLVPSNTNPAQYVVADSYEREQAPTPLPFYSFDPPSGWTQTQNAGDTANRSSTSYLDVYQNEAGETLTFSQSAAGNGAMVSGVGECQAATYGGVEMILYRSQDGRPGSGQPESGAFWIYGQTLLQLSCQQYLETEEMLELVRRVCYDPPRQPDYTPLSFELVREEGDGGDYYSYYVRGNPALPDPLLWFDFDTPPAGFAKSEVQTESSLDTQYYSTYSNPQGMSIMVFCDAAPNLGLFTDTKPPQVQQVEVDGKPGLVHLSAENQGYEIVWLEDYCYVCVSATFPMTTEELLALASAVRQNGWPPGQRPLCAPWIMKILPFFLESGFL